ncbi:MAG: putative Ig domain-containing protein, partial [Verrucomicrobiota bacterium]
MKRFLIHSHVLAAFLQLAPLARIAQTAPGLIATPTLCILRWVFGPAAVAGSFHGLSGATGMVPTAVRATNGVRMSVTFSITSSSHGTARSYSALSGLPPGTTLSTRGTLSGTPTSSGSYTLRIRGWQNTNLSGNWSDQNVALTVVGANP